MANEETAADVIRRRRAVFGALLTIFPRADAHAAVAIWDRDYRHGRSQYDGLNVFARQVCGQFAQPGRHRELIQRLMEFFFAPESALPPDPGTHDRQLAIATRPIPAADPLPASVSQGPAVPPLEPANPAPSTEAAQVDAPRPMGPAATAGAADSARAPGAPPHVATWLRLIARLVADLQPHDRAAALTLVRAMLQSASSLGVDPVARELLRLALEGRYNERLVRVTNENLHALLNFAYVHIATAIGPVAADRVMTQSIQAVDGTPEGRNFAPRKLL